MSKSRMLLIGIALGLAVVSILRFPELILVALAFALLANLPHFDAKSYAGTFVFNTTDVDKETVSIEYDGDLDQLYSEKEVTFKVINQD